MICRTSYKICLCRYSTPVSGTVLSCRTDNCAFIHGVIRWSIYTAYKTVILGIIAEIGAEQCRRYSRNDIGIPTSICHFNLSVIFYWCIALRRITSVCRIIYITFRCQFKFKFFIIYATLSGKNNFRCLSMHILLITICASAHYRCKHYCRKC